jgi:adenosylmethionine-8-amino-7-oxononanoate aminotransferase
VISCIAGKGAVSLTPMKLNLSERDQQVIWHPYTAQKYAPAPIPIIRGEGVYLEDPDGNRYIDAISSWWVTIHGHAHPYIAQKIYEQALELEQVIFAGFTHEPAVRLAERLLPVLPGNFSKIFYSDNGSTAVEVALKMAIQYWWNSGQKNRTKVFAFHNAYHGDTFGAMSVSARSVFNAAFETYMFEVIYLDTPTAANFEANRSIIDAHARTTACFIYEPLLQGAGGMVMYEAEHLDNLVRYIRQKDILCIADEVLTGFGRTGKFFAGEYLQEKADIICLSKGLTGGTMAMGISACTEKVHGAFVSEQRTKTFFHGHSFTANPIACAAALASLDLLLEEKCLAQIKMINKSHLAFRDQIASVNLPDKMVQNIRVLGTVLAFEYQEEQKDYLNQSASGLTLQALQQSVFIRPLGNTVYLMPPYCITPQQLNTIYHVILDILQKNAH